MKYRDMTVKPQAAIEPVAQAPSSPAVSSVPDRYRGTAALQAQSEATISRVLGHIAPELAGEVVRRAASDERFSPAERAALDPEGKSLQANLDELTRELREAEREQVNSRFRARLDALRN